MAEAKRRTTGVRMYRERAKTGTGGRMVKLMVAISFDKGVVICKTYEKLDGCYFASFIDENFESMFSVADKSALRLWVQDGDPI